MWRVYSRVLVQLWLLKVSNKREEFSEKQNHLIEIELAKMMGKRKAQIIGYMPIYLGGYFEKWDRGKKMEWKDRLEYFPQIRKDMRCGSFNEVEQLAWDCFKVIMDKLEILTNR